ncbi:uncharacterized protein LOC128590048 isoform X2 [Nycticebus coucang]|uniref:uncharacterized protein LOC128590048 isoform X2 n=1 Tax=Nycticebus coucang TaxID=9470 RepID=UPI00234D35C2|nr:uncharacterized protein LOC128590048 isoform X2 [Nycticebus coucang]
MQQRSDTTCGKQQGLSLGRPDRRLGPYGSKSPRSQARSGGIRQLGRRVREPLRPRVSRAPALRPHLCSPSPRNSGFARWGGECGARPQDPLTCTSAADQPPPPQPSPGKPLQLASRGAIQPIARDAAGAGQPGRKGRRSRNFPGALKLPGGGSEKIAVRVIHCRSRLL